MRLRDDDAERYEGPACVALAWTPAPDVIVTRFRGHADRGALSFYTTRAQRIIDEQGHIYVFHHWAEVNGWDPSVREDLRRWAADRAKALWGSHFLVRTKVLSMALQVAALALGRKLDAYNSEAHFFAALERTLGRRDRSPT